MACSNRRFYYLISPDKQYIYAYDKHGYLKKQINLPWVKPYLFKFISDAQREGDRLRMDVRYWPGRLYKNHPDDNK